MIRALLILAAVASLAASAQAQQPQRPKPQEPPQNVRCIKDSFGNYTHRWTRVIHDSFDTVFVIPGRERAR